MERDLLAACWGMVCLTANLFAAPPANPAQVALTDEQSAWVSAHSPIRVGVTRWPPFSYESTNGTQAGIDIDVLQLISKRTGVNFEIVAGESWEKILDLFERGRIDATTGTAHTLEREKIFRFTRPYYKSVVVTVTREGDWRYPTIALLKNAVIAMPVKHVTTVELKKRLPFAHIIEADTQEECFKIVAEQKPTQPSPIFLPSASI